MMIEHLRYVITMTCLLYTAVFAASNTDPPAPDAVGGLPPDVLFVAQGIQNTADTALQQVVGTVRACYQRKQSGQVSLNRLRKFEFYVDGDKMRWDRYFVKPNTDGKEYMLHEQYAFNGQAVSQFRHTLDGQPTSTAHIRPAELCKRVTQSTYNGDTFHPRSLYVPRDFYGKDLKFVEMLEFFSSRGYKMSVEGNVHTDSTVALRVGHDKASKPIEIKLHVDIANGFLIKKCEYLLAGECFAEAFREYERDPETGAMLLTRFDKRRYASGFKHPSTHVMEIEYTSVNAPIPGEKFTLAGFDLPLGTKIMDMRFDGLKYSVGAPEQIQEEMNAKLAELGSMSSSSHVSLKAVTEEDVRTPAQEESPMAADARRTIAQSASPARQTKSYVILAVGMVGVVTLIALLAKFYRQRPIRR